MYAYAVPMNHPFCSSQISMIHSTGICSAGKGDDGDRDPALDSAVWSKAQKLSTCSLDVTRQS